MATEAVGKPRRAASLVPSSSLTQYAAMLRVILELDDVVVTIGAAHQVRLRAPTHPSYLLQRPRHAGFMLAVLIQRGKTD